LLFLVKRLLCPIIDALAHRGYALVRLSLCLDQQQTQITPAEPTLDSVLLLDLVRLKLKAMSFTGGIRNVRLVADRSPASHEQLALFRTTAKRDLRAAERALARLRAEFGETSVCFAQLREGHLHEARFALQPAQRLTTPAPRHHDERPLVRRYYQRARTLPYTQRRDPDGWMVAGISQGPVQEVCGPFVVSGGWWRSEIRRDYYFLALARGNWLWVYFDHRQRLWRQVGALT
jgi:protein ImuB